MKKSENQSDLSDHINTTTHDKTFKHYKNIFLRLKFQPTNDFKDL